MSPSVIAATLLTVIYIHLASSSSLLSQPDIGSQCEESDSSCELSEAKLKVSELEAALEGRSKRLETRSLHLDELERRNNELNAEILRLESLVNELKDAELLPEDEVVRSLWSILRENNFDLHILESKALEAEERLEDVKLKVEKMADTVTEQWIQFRHLEQALQGLQVKIVESERELCLKKCSLFKRLPLLLDEHLSRHRPAIKFYWSRILIKLNVYLTAVKLYHLQLQQFVRQELKKTQLTSVYTSEELVFFVASGLLTLPLLCFLMMLLSLLN